MPDQVRHDDGRFMGQHLMQQLRAPLLILTLFSLLIPLPAIAGGSPETTLLVVNADSPLSLTVANIYTRLREIPGNHVVWLHDIPSLGKIDIKTFRERIWAPVRKYMDKQGLAEDIDSIVYSADFPYAVDLRQELKQHKVKPHRYIGRYASLTGLTYFAWQVENNKIGYLSRYPNRYFRRDLTVKINWVENLKKEDEIQLKNARKALRKKEYQAAYENLLSLNRKYPHRASILLPLAEVQARLEKRDQAISSLKQLEALGVHNSLVLRNSRHLKKLHDDPEFMRILQRMDTPSARFEKPHGFRSRYHWSRYVLPQSDIDSDKYFLSAMLAYTGQRGNSLPEIKYYLERSAASDGSHPNGTVYLMENGDIRAEARQPWYSDTCALLKEIDKRCEILSRGVGSRRGILPENRQDIIGLTTGARSFKWNASNSKLFPGAIADSFTSYGGDFDNRKQTKLTEFLRQGAAGSSGAVTEPFSIAEKFPLPPMHYYYAMGSSLAEAWYQAVASPYQAILVGDPLAQPFADFSKPRLARPNPDRPWQGEVYLYAETSASNSQKISQLELWVDGLPVSEAPAGKPLIWDTRTVSDGFHDLRLVAVDDDPIETRSYRRYSIYVSNKTIDFEVKVKNNEPVYYENIVITGKAADDTVIEIFQGSRVLGSIKVENGDWKIMIPSEKLGIGTVVLSVIATGTNGDRIYTKPLSLNIKPAPDSPAVNENFSGEPGLLATLQYKNAGNEFQKIEKLDGRYKNLINKKLPLEKIQINGQFRVNQSGFHQLTISTKNQITITVDGQRYQREAPMKEYSLVYLPLFLKKGWHDISIQPSPEGMEKLTVLLSGNQVPMILGGKHVRYNKNIM